MKKILVSAFAAAATAAAFAGMNDILISFSTPGPDTYSDGTPVLDGERYALVWTPNGEDFEGINDDGTPKGGSKIVASAPIAKDGRCPDYFFEIDEGYAKANYPEGTWRVCLLDTRVFKIQEDGQPELDEAGNRKVVSKGSKNVVNGYGVVGQAAVVSSTDLSTGLGGVKGASETPSANTPAPEVKGITFDDDYVYVKISTTRPTLKYTLVSGSTPSAVSAPVSNPEGTGFGNEKKEITLITPKKPGGEFFKVNAK